MEWVFRLLFGLFGGWLACHLSGYGVNDYQSFWIMVACVFIAMLPWSIMLDVLLRMD